MTIKQLGVIAAFGTLAFTALAFRPAAPEPVSGPESGLKVGDMVSAYDPNHVTGPLKGTTTCPT
jgi:hypothetical protein